MLNRLRRLLEARIIGNRDKAGSGGGIPDYYTRSAKKQNDIRHMEPFGSLARRVIEDRRSYLYYDRLYTIYQAVENMLRLPAGVADVAEVGVYRGGGSYFIASALRALGMDKSSLYCFDTFEGHSEADISGKRDNTVIHSTEKFRETSYEQVRDYLKEFPRVDIHKGRIQETAGAVADRRFGFVHADVDLYEPTLFILDYFGARMIPGGVFVVDDYNKETCKGVPAAIDEFLAAHPNYFKIGLLSAQCVLVKHQ